MSDIFQPNGSSASTNSPDVFYYNVDCVIKDAGIQYSGWSEPDLSGRFTDCPCGASSSAGEVSLSLSGVSLAGGVEEWTHNLDISGGEIWTSADIPAGKELTSISYSVIIANSGNQVVDFDGNTLFNIPAGYSASFGPANPLNPPQSISAGASPGRILVAFTVKDA